MSRIIPSSKTNKVTLSVMYIVLIIICSLLLKDSFSNNTFNSKRWLFIVPVIVGLFRLYTIWRRR